MADERLRGSVRVSFNKHKAMKKQVGLIVDRLVESSSDCCRVRKRSHTTYRRGDERIKNLLTGAETSAVNRLIHI